MPTRDEVVELFSRIGNNYARRYVLYHVHLKHMWRENETRINERMVAAGLGEPLPARQYATAFNWLERNELIRETSTGLLYTLGNYGDLIASYWNDYNQRERNRIRTAGRRQARLLREPLIAPPVVVTPPPVAVTPLPPRAVRPTGKDFGLGVEHEFFAGSHDGEFFHIVGGQDSIGFSTHLEGPDGRFEVTGYEGSASVGGIGTSGQPTPRLMEHITPKWRKKTVEDMSKTVLEQEKVVLTHLRQRNRADTSIAKNKSKLDSDIIVIPFGAFGPARHKGRGDLKKVTGGSYHFTFTLPYDDSMTDTQYAKMYRQFIRHIQWFQPLLMANYGGADPDSIGDDGRYIEGSHRLAATVWGTPGGSQAGKFTTIGTGGAKQRQIASPTWRLGDRARGTIGITNRKDVQKNHPGYSDIITMRGGDKEIPLEKGVAVELRFMDSFDAGGVKDLLRSLVYIAANAQSGRDDRDLDASDSPPWNTAMTKIMKEGWNTYLNPEYIEKLRETTRLPIDTQSKRASDVYQQANKELFEASKDHEISRYFLEREYSEAPKPKNYNRLSWEFFFANILRNNEPVKMNLKNIIEQIPHDSTMSSRQFAQIIKGQDEDVLGLPGYGKEDIRDLLDFLENEEIIKVERSANGSIDSLQLMAPTPESLRRFDESILLKNQMRKVKGTGVEMITVQPTVEAARRTLDIPGTQHPDIKKGAILEMLEVLHTPTNRDNFWLLVNGEQISNRGFNQLKRLRLIESENQIEFHRTMAAGDTGLTRFGLHTLLAIDHWYSLSRSQQRAFARRTKTRRYNPFSDDYLLGRFATLNPADDEIVNLRRSEKRYTYGLPKNFRDFLHHHNFPINYQGIGSEYTTHRFMDDAEEIGLIERKFHWKKFTPTEKEEIQRVLHFTITLDESDSVYLEGRYLYSLTDASKNSFRQEYPNGIIILTSLGWAIKSDLQGNPERLSKRAKRMTKDLGPGWHTYHDSFTKAKQEREKLRHQKAGRKGAIARLRKHGK